MKQHVVLVSILLSFIATTSGLSKKDTCIILTGSSLNPDSYHTVKKILETQLGLFPGHQPFGSGRGMRSYHMNLEHPVLVNSSVVDSFSVI